jgi:hypothetical protein
MARSCSSEAAVEYLPGRTSIGRRTAQITRRPTSGKPGETGVLPPRLTSRTRSRDPRVSDGIGHWYWMCVSSGHPVRSGSADRATRNSPLLRGIGSVISSARPITAAERGKRPSKSHEWRSGGRGAGQNSYGRSKRQGVAPREGRQRRGSRAPRPGRPVQHLLRGLRGCIVHPRRYHASGSTPFRRWIDTPRVSKFSDRRLPFGRPSPPARPSSLRSRNDRRIHRTYSSPGGLCAISAQGRQPLRWPTSPRSARLRTFDYVVIATAGLEAAATRLATLRESFGLRATVVSLEDVMDEFENGSTPHAASSSGTPISSGQASGSPCSLRGGIDKRDLWSRRPVPPLVARLPMGSTLPTTDSATWTTDGRVSVGRIPR